MDKKLIVLLLTVLSTLSGVTYMTLKQKKHSSFRHEATPNEILTAWQAWQIQFKKTYSQEELPMRYSVFTTNYKWIQDFNNKGGRKFTVGLNQFADLTNQEFGATKVGKLIRSNAPKNYVPLNNQIPTSINWASKGAVTPVKDQGNCGSCWAFGSTGTLEGLNFIKNGKLLSFSEQQLVDCSDAYGNEGCNGGNQNWALNYTSSYGIELESAYPYTGEDGTCAYKKTDIKFQNTGYVTVETNADALKQAVALVPTTVSIEADSNSFQFYTSGIYDDASCGTNLDHAVLATGYDTTGSTPYWIVKNSWGSSWGNAGYIWIQIANGDGICGINLENYYPTA